jgi:NhaA family Na+:H+ antiporter
MWYFMLQSGVHATISGVLLAFALPFGDGSETSPSYKLQHFLHKPIAFGIMPVFALANTGIPVSGTWLENLFTPNSLGVFAGLFVGKPLGMFLVAFLSVRTRLSQLPGDLSWKHILGAGFLGGIGFTMSIFITLLAFSDPEIVQATKISIVVSSILAGITGFVFLSTQTENGAQE